MSAGPSAGTASFSVDSARGLESLGEALGRALEKELSRHTSLLLALDGELGAGKTTLTAGTLRALGVRSRITSPTYSLVHPYVAKFPDSGEPVHVLHVDLYRVKLPAELDELDLLEDRLAVPGAARQLLMVEWFENAAGRLGAPDIAMLLRYAQSGRQVRMQGISRTGQRIVALLRNGARLETDSAL